MTSVYQCLLRGKDYAVDTEALNKNWVGKKRKKPRGCEGGDRKGNV